MLMTGQLRAEGCVGRMVGASCEGAVSADMCLKPPHACRKPVLDSIEAAPAAAISSRRLT